MYYDEGNRLSMLRGIIMKQHVHLWLGILAAVLLAGCGDSLTGPQKKSAGMKPLTRTEQQLATTSQNFGVDLFRQVNATQQGANVFISPLSLSMALGMVVNGAAGQTQADILKAMDLQGMSLQDMNTAFQGLSGALLAADPKVQMELANSIWYRNAFSVEKDFIQTDQKYYDAKVQGLDFNNGKQAAGIINGWVSDKTHGKITKMVSPPIPRDLVMYLMNAIYFKGDWRTQFDKKDTRPGPFTLSDGSKVQPEMMHMTSTLPVFMSDSVQAIDLAYGDSLFSMTILMPPAGTNIDHFVGNLSWNKLNTWIGELHATNVQLTMPKFEIKYKIGLIPVLTTMGMGIAFDKRKADFSKINPNGRLYISKVLQKSYISVDEEGTEAAAVTEIAASYATSVRGPQYLVFNIDRPFVYLIRERTSGAILFIGKMENPAE